nr:sigma factor [Odoribacter splanchnicus]
MNKVTDIDLQWYEAVRQDNYPAFEKLFQKYYDPLCRYAQGLLADVSPAEDAVQDMFIHFWENRIKLQIKSPLRAYFYTCICHRALNICKNRPLSGNITRN